MLSHGDHVTHRKASCKREEKDFVGWFYGLPEREQEALVELARRTVKEMRDIDRTDHRTLDEYHKAHAPARITLMLARTLTACCSYVVAAEEK